MKSINDITKDYFDGKYTYQTQPIPPRLKDNYIFDENKTVKENRQMLVDYNEHRLAIIHNNQAGEKLACSQLRNDVVQALMDNYGVSRERANFVEQFCFERDHSYLDSYFNTIEDMLSDFLKFSKLS